MNSRRGWQVTVHQLLLNQARLADIKVMQPYEIVIRRITTYACVLA